jgi:glutamate N-acetyltransferase / amino-acid N-acetyltransferase
LQVKPAAMRAVVINAGNANACTGEQGLADAARMAALAEAALDLPAGSALVMSTGVIGLALPMDKVEAGIREAGTLARSETGQSKEPPLLWPVSDRATTGCNSPRRPS